MTELKKVKLGPSSLMGRLGHPPPHGPLGGQSKAERVRGVGCGFDSNIMSSCQPTGSLEPGSGQLRVDASNQHDTSLGCAFVLNILESFRCSKYSPNATSWYNNEPLGTSSCGITQVISAVFLPMDNWVISNGLI